MELDRKTKPRYLGPTVVIHKTEGGSFILAEVDGTLSKLQYAAKHLILYSSRTVVLGEWLSYLFNLSNEELYVMTHSQSDEACIADSDDNGFDDDIAESPASARDI